jgi:5-methylcytosine-specific restriction endonuclease McrA
VPIVKQCPTCRRLIPAGELRQHRIDVHGLRNGSTRAWRKQRVQIIERDEGRCGVCGSTENLEVHHIDGNPQNDDLDNLETRCRTHNPRGSQDYCVAPPATTFRMS